MGYTKIQLLARLKELHIDFATFEHPAVLTVEAQAKYVGHLGGGLSKNLLLKDKKHRYYMISALAGTNVDLKVLSQRLGLGKGGLRMAPEEALQEILQVPLGCVTPLALINESASAVSLLLDQAFKAQECCFFHPLSNDTTISLSATNLDMFLSSIGRNPSYVDLEAQTVVGKDNPPDLAAFVPVEVPQPPLQTISAAVTHVHEQKHAPLEKRLTNVQEADNLSKNSKKATEKPSRTSDVLAEATDVKKFIKELIEKTSLAVLSEISKDAKDDGREPLKSAVLDGVNKRIASDLENLAMILKNAAYTQGFQAGIQRGWPR
ncbi:prolyl-tRNA synthetase associated domain-containing protein 1 [Phalaenopsis equestris]|uniref:prolyl-tRNA synthetase associated domain-containing protein 1 n=1 Tax=Phalaenopsis equestris TaxID=78828 RepID=UPI0009E499B2|nr:prolyl-tRNA synthetase associated domain-containing protein 1 [Phalaenopsis equestris]